MAWAATPPAPGRTALPSWSLTLLKRKHKRNKKDEAFLVVETGIVTQGESRHCFHTQVCHNPNWFISPDLFTASRSPSHSDLCRFKVSVLGPLEWGHQTLSCFGFPTFPHSSYVCSLLVLWPECNHTAAFALDLMSTYEGEHTTFGLLGQANLTQNDVLQFHPFTSE
jgi:hypothetical protein